MRTAVAYVICSGSERCASVDPRRVLDEAMAAASAARFRGERLLGASVGVLEEVEDCGHAWVDGPFRWYARGDGR